MSTRRKRVHIYMIVNNQREEDRLRQALEQPVAFDDSPETRDVRSQKRSLRRRLDLPTHCGSGRGRGSDSEKKKKKQADEALWVTVYLSTTPYRRR